MISSAILSLFCLRSNFELRWSNSAVLPSQDFSSSYILILFFWSLFLYYLYFFLCDYVCIVSSCADWTNISQSLLIGKFIPLQTFIKTSLTKRNAIITLSWIDVLRLSISFLFSEKTLLGMLIQWLRQRPQQTRVNSCEYFISPKSL